MNRTIRCPFCTGIGFINKTNFFGSSKKVVREKCTDCEGAGRIDISKCRKKKK